MRFRRIGRMVCDMAKVISLSSRYRNLRSVHAATFHWHWLWDFLNLHGTGAQPSKNSEEKETETSKINLQFWDFMLSPSFIPCCGHLPFRYHKSASSDPSPDWHWFICCTFRVNVFSFFLLILQSGQNNGTAEHDDDDAPSNWSPKQKEKKFQFFINPRVSVKWP